MMGTGRALGLPLADLLEEVRRELLREVPGPRMPARAAVCMPGAGNAPRTRRIPRRTPAHTEPLAVGYLSST